MAYYPGNAIRNVPKSQAFHSVASHTNDAIAHDPRRLTLGPASSCLSTVDGIDAPG